MGDAGGDDDWYGYCLDDPVNSNDPVGLKGHKTVDGVTYDENGVPIGEVGLEAPDIDLVMDLIPIPPVFRGATKVGKAVKKVYKTGQEFKIGKKIRVAPMGNRTKHPIGKYPHYHRRGKLDPKTGQPVKGQGKKRHRPAEKREGDKSFWDRF